jgi:uncharacterized membrane protein
MINTIIQLACLFAIPVLIHNVLRDKSISRWLSPVVVCFILGIAAGTYFPEQINRSHSSSVQDITILIAIPMLLMSSDFMRWLPKAKAVMFSFFVSCLSVLTAVVIAFFVFRERTEDAWLVSSMLLAGFTGTIANANAVGNALDCPEDLLLLVNLGDMITGAIYLIVLTSVAHPLLSRFLPAYQPFMTSVEGTDRPQKADAAIAKEDFSYLSAYRMRRFGIYVLPVLISAGILALTMGSEMLLFPAEGLKGNFILMSVTILGILVSFSGKIRRLKSSYRIGQYLLLVFCLALGTLIDFHEALTSSPLILIYAAIVMLILITMNLTLAKIFRIDADTTIITSAATIYGPPFIGQVAMSMKNKEIVFSGMIASMVGIAAGNFLGLGLAGLLQRLM